MCTALGLGCALLAVAFGIMKENAAKFVAGFNDLPKKEQEQYDKARMIKDMRNDFIIWTVVMLVGAIGSYVVSSFVAIIAYVIWLILFFKDFHWDARKAFAKYLIE